MKKRIAVSVGRLSEALDRFERVPRIAGAGAAIEQGQGHQSADQQCAHPCTGVGHLKSHFVFLIESVICLTIVANIPGLRNVSRHGHGVRFGCLTMTGYRHYLAIT